MIDQFNCHATSTPVGDLSEARCIKSILAADQALRFRDDMRKFAETDPEAISTHSELSKSTQSPILTANKGNLGHCVAGAGAIESALAFLSLHHDKVVKIRNLEEPLDKDLSFAMENQDCETNVIVKNALVFGGINCSLVFKKYRVGGKL